MTMFRNHWPVKCVLLVIAGMCQFSLADKDPLRQSSGFSQLTDSVPSSSDFKSSASYSSSSNIPSSIDPRIVPGSSNAREVSGSNNITPFGFDYSQNQNKPFGNTAFSPGINNFDYSTSADSSPSFSNSYGIGQAQASSGSSYAPTSGNIPAQTLPHDVGQSYTYHYQHFPQGNSAYGAHGSGEEGLFGDSLGGIAGLGGGLGGLGGLGIGGLKILGVLAKGALIIKPILILLGLTFLLIVPVLALFFPFPIVTINRPVSPPDGGAGAGSRQNPGILSHSVSYLTQLTDKVLNSEQCMERIICKMPQAPEKYQSKAKMLWDQYGSTFIQNARLQRGLGAYFEEQDKKNRNFKCNQKFSCSNKLL